MHSMFLQSLLISIALLSTTGWAQYVLEDDYLSDGNFFDMFSFFTSADPTHGSVSYVDQNTANKDGLIHLNNGQVYMGVDHTNVAPNGRASVRLTSNKSYNSGLVILDLQKMPGGICGTWPAFWMVGSNWPNNGEIDIIEGVNDQTTNDMTLHTNDGCSISSTAMTGSIATSNCYINAAGQYSNQGCGITTGNTKSYGAGFNSNGGGVYATEWTSSAIKIYFFPRGSIPSDITNGQPNPSSWGSPTAIFQGNCNIPDHFKDLQIVFDTTFCGDWASGVWGSSSCASKASTCEAFVANNPSAFVDANWLINSLKVYQPISWSSTNGAVVQPAQKAQSNLNVIQSVTSTQQATPTTMIVQTTKAAQVTTSIPVQITTTTPVVATTSTQAAPAAPTTPQGHIITTDDVSAWHHPPAAARHLLKHLKW